MNNDRRHGAMQWHVWNPDEEARAEASLVEAYDAGHAAEIWAADYDGGNENPLLQGGHVDVMVAPADGQSKPIKLRVTGEAVPEYTAHSVCDSCEEQPRCDCEKEPRCQSA
jgi:hypothetical protein